MENERSSYMQYIADSLHYQPQGKYLAAKWRDRAENQPIPEPYELADDLSARYGIEVI